MKSLTMKMYATVSCLFFFFFFVSYFDKKECFFYHLPTIHVVVQIYSIRILYHTLLSPASLFKTHTETHVYIMIPYIFRCYKTNLFLLVKRAHRALFVFLFNSPKIKLVVLENHIMKSKRMCLCLSVSVSVVHLAKIYVMTNNHNL